MEPRKETFAQIVGENCLTRPTGASATLLSIAQIAVHGFQLFATSHMTGL